MKKTFIIAALAFLTGLKGNAQSGKDNPRTRYGIYAQLGYSKPNDGFLGNEFISDQPQKLYSLGMTMRHRLSQRWTISSGAALTYTRFKVWGETLPDVTNPAYTLPRYGEWDCMPIVQSVLYANATELSVDVPVLMQYYIAKERFFISSGLEMNAGLYMNYKSAHQGYDGTITKINRTEPFSAYRLMLPLGFGFNVTVGNKHLLSIEPGIKVLMLDYNTYGNFNGLYTLRTSFYF